MCVSHEVCLDKEVDSLQLNYLTKYVELIDTVFLMAKKKPLSGLTLQQSQQTFY